MRKSADSVLVSLDDFLPDTLSLTGKFHHQFICVTTVIDHKNDTVDYSHTSTDDIIISIIYLWILPLGGNLSSSLWSILTGTQSQPVRPKTVSARGSHESLKRFVRIRVASTNSQDELLSLSCDTLYRLTVCHIHDSEFILTFILKVTPIIVCLPLGGNTVTIMCLHVRFTAPVIERSRYAFA